MAQLNAIVVPVFNAAAETRRCFDALKATIPDRQSVIVIDDASTDPEIADLLARLPASWVRVSNRENAGFVGSANLGISLASPADVILLNSDTQVTRGWLKALLDCAGSDRRIASVTPLSNNAEIASIPAFCQNNPVPDDLSQWAQACLESGPPEYPDVPTGVGFCLFMRRACLDDIGSFDEAAFGRGYGEENDWCMRASGAGWRNVLCDAAFVAHEGNASFGPLGLAPNDRAMETLLARHPDYMERVREFIDADPMAARREVILNYYRSLSQAGDSSQPRNVV